MANDVRRHPPLDDVDRLILQTLLDDGRLPNNALAEKVGVAPSTCLARVRALREAGVIRGVNADVDLAALGRTTEAMILVELRENARGHVEAFKASIADMPGVISFFYLTGTHDYLLHVAVADSGALRELLQRAGFEAIELRPIRNAYPLRYWLRLTPLPAAIKNALLGVLQRLGLADRSLAMNVGNMLAVGIKPR